MDEETTKRIVSELGEAEYAELKETYCKVQELQALIRSIHGAYVAEGTPPAIESGEGALRAYGRPVRWTGAVPSAALH